MKNDKLDKFGIEPLVNRKEVDKNADRKIEIKKLDEVKNTNTKNDDLGLSRISLDSSTYLSDTEFSAKMLDPRPVLPNRKDNTTLINNLQNIN